MITKLALDATETLIKYRGIRMISSISICGGGTSRIGGYPDTVHRQSQ